MHNVELLYEDKNTLEINMLSFTTISVRIHVHVHIELKCVFHGTCKVSREGIQTVKCLQ